MTLLVDSLGYVAIGAPDVDDATAFFADICQLEISERREDTVFLRGDARHHWVRIERRENPGVIRVGYQVRSSASRSEIQRRLEAAGIAWTASGELAVDRVSGGFTFTDPNGIVVELYEEMAEWPAAPRRRGVDLDQLLHAVFLVDDVVAARDFWYEVLDFRRSDQVEELACFMRCGNGYHHSVGFLRGPGSGGALDHFCVLVPAIDDVMRMQNLAKHVGVPMEHEALRHAASGSIGCYLQYPALKLGIEYCTGHGRLDDEDPGRLLVASPWTVNVWNSLPTVSPGSWLPSGELQSLGNVYAALESDHMGTNSPADAL